MDSLPNIEPTRGHDKTINYEVNGEPQTTSDRKLSGRHILERAGFTPAEDYILTSSDRNREIDLDRDEPIHDGERFLAKFRGPTPTS